MQCVCGGRAGDKGRERGRARSVGTASSSRLGLAAVGLAEPATTHSTNVAQTAKRLAGFLLFAHNDSLSDAQSRRFHDEVWSSEDPQLRGSWSCDSLDQGTTRRKVRNFLLKFDKRYRYAFILSVTRRNGMCCWHNYIGSNLSCRARSHSDQLVSPASTSDPQFAPVTRS